jgi:dienelactone hydrolase
MLARFGDGDHPVVKSLVIGHRAWHHPQMSDVVVFHSVLGLRPMELRAADRLRAASHRVVTPDLYAGETATTLGEAFDLKDRIGWTTIEQRARDAVRELPAEAVLAGVSMGAGVVQTLLPDRPATAGVLLLHGLAAVPASVRAGLPVQVHVADPDAFAPPDEVTTWREATTRAGADARLFTYRNVDHFYTDTDLPGYDEPATTLTWQRALDFLRAISP